jgi:hypothetical protein
MAPVHTLPRKATPQLHDHLESPSAVEHVAVVDRTRMEEVVERASKEAKLAREVVEIAPNHQIEDYHLLQRIVWSYPR